MTNLSSALLPNRVKDKISLLTPEAVLAVPETRYADLFVPDLGAIEEIMRRARSKVHPDKNIGREDQAAAAIVHLDKLKSQALKAHTEGIWVMPGKTKFNPCEITLIGDRSDLVLSGKLDQVPGVGYSITGLLRTSILFDPENGDMADMFAAATTKLHAAAVRLHLPAADHLKLFLDGISLTSRERQVKNRRLVSMPYGDEYIRLEDILVKCGPLDPRAVTWIMTRLHNVCSLCQVADVPHLDLCLSTVFIDPLIHSVRVPVGWWYAKSFSGKPLAAPARTLGLCPDISSSKIFTVQNQLKLVRALGLELLGDPTGINLHKRADVPPELAAWLLSTPNKDAVEDEKNWGKVKTRLFGGPKWHALDIDKAEVYS